MIQSLARAASSRKVMVDKKLKAYLKHWPSVWAWSEKALENAIGHLKEGLFEEVREPVGEEKLRVWYMKDGELKSHLYTNEELDSKTMAESWRPTD